ncbi:MAG: hypothetical protein JWN48_2349 [Myxococcaceae bacterium]|nr:hypothetical protein [Myxococcaceae bacterium]
MPQAPVTNVAGSNTVVTIESTYRSRLVAFVSRPPTSSCSGRTRHALRPRPARALCPSLAQLARYLACPPQNELVRSTARARGRLTVRSHRHGVWPNGAPAGQLLWCAHGNSAPLPASSLAA